MPVYNYLDLCISHLTERDVEIITADLDKGESAVLTGNNREYGFWLHVCAEPDGSEEHREAIAEALDLGLSKLFLACYQKARELGCYWMLFDTDADEHAGLLTRDDLD